MAHYARKRWGYARKRSKGKLISTQRRGCRGTCTEVIMRFQGKARATRIVECDIAANLQYTRICVEILPEEKPKRAIS